MNTPKHLLLIGLGLVVAIALPGCAAYDSVYGGAGAGAGAAATGATGGSSAAPVGAGVAGAGVVGADNWAECQEYNNCGQLPPPASPAPLPGEFDHRFPGRPLGDASWEKQERERMPPYVVDDPEAAEEWMTERRKHRRIDNWARGQKDRAMDDWGEMQGHLLGTSSALRELQKDDVNERQRKVNEWYADKHLDKAEQRLQEARERVEKTRNRRLRNEQRQGEQGEP